MNVGFCARSSGKYSVSAALYNGTTYLTSAVTSRTYGKGNQSVALVFDVKPIITLGYYGHFTLSDLVLSDSQGTVLLYAREPYRTKAYPKNQLVPATFSFEIPYSDRGIDKNWNGKYNLLEINGTARVKKPGGYRISGSITDAHGGLVSSAYTDLIVSSAGSYPYSLDFSGDDLINATRDGPFSLTDFEARSLSSDTILDVCKNVYRTGLYKRTQFEGEGAGGSGIVLTGTYSATGIDTDHNGRFNFLDLVVGVRVGRSDNYTSDFRITDSKDREVNQNLTFRIDGRRIYGLGSNGPVVIRMLNMFTDDLLGPSIRAEHVYTSPVLKQDTFEPCGIITGTIIFKGQGVSNATVLASNDKAPDSDMTMSDSSGLYTLSFMSEGTYTVNAT